MNRSDYHRQACAQGYRQVLSHPKMGPMAPISIPGAFALAALQFDVSVVVDALCHVVTDYGHGVCSYREVFTAVSEAYRVALKPLPAYMYHPIAAVVSGGLLSPFDGDEELLAFGPEGCQETGCQEGAFIASLVTLERAHNPLRLPCADLASGRVAHTGEHALLIIVPRPSYEALYQEMDTPQRVRPVLKNGRLEITGIDAGYDPAAHRGLCLDDLLGR